MLPTSETRICCHQALLVNSRTNDDRKRGYWRGAALLRLTHPTPFPMSYRVQFGLYGLADVNDVDPTAAQRWQHQFVPRLAAVTMATRAGVPAAVVQLIIQMGHHQSVHHLRGGGDTQVTRQDSREGTNYRYLVLTLT